MKAVFYLNRINFTQQGSGEHRDLCLSQFQFGRKNDPDSIDDVDDTEFGLKNRQHLQRALVIMKTYVM